MSTYILVIQLYYMQKETKVKAFSTKKNTYRTPTSNRTCV